MNHCLKILLILCLLGGIVLISACDQASRHKMLTTVFDGVPELPPVDDLCQDYVDNISLDEAYLSSAEDAASEASMESGSSHPPYEEKDCGGCHQQGAGNALIAPPRELCFICHVDFIEDSFVHGPVAVADCLACHLPHSSSHESLLVKGKSEICSSCHKEERLAAGLHDSVENRGIPCVECHGAHFGKNQFFLK